MGADLIKREDILREFVDNILDAVIFVSYSYHLKWANREALRMLGYEEAEITDKNFKSILGENIVSRWDNFCNLLTEAPIKNYDAVLKKKNGSEIPVKMNIMPFTDFTETASGWLIMAKDVTMMRNAIKELTRIHKKLKHSLKELEHSQDELIHSEKLSFAGRIAATVAHEIRNPLNIISMAMQQLHNELRKKDPHREYTKMVLEHITRVNKLLTEFVNVTRPLKLRMRWDDINIVLEDVLKLMEPKFQERRVALIKNLDINLPEIKFDKDQMIEAFTNLLLNSCEALPKRGGRIWVNSKREGDFIEIKIRNSGKPILKKDLIRIFDPFFTTKTTGTGLGTSIAYNIIGSHRGTITVDSDRKIGTTFTIRMSLPEEREGDYAE